MIFNYKNFPEDIKTLQIKNYKEIAGITSKDVDLNDPDLYEKMEEFGWQLAKTCYENQGIGLAAPQVGVYKNVFIMVGFLDPHIWQLDGGFHIAINPTCTPSVLTDSMSFPEGCLSVPNKTIDIVRPRRVDVEYWYFNKNKKLKKNIETLEGYPSRIFQHEFEHLSGGNIVESSKTKKTKPRKRNF